MKKILFVLVTMIVCVEVSAHVTGIYFYFDNVEKHVYEDDNVKVFLYPSDDGKVCVIVNNKTKKVVYVDNGSSFFYNNSSAACMYRSRSTTTGTMQGHGVAVNLGGLAYGFGARGNVATALSAITVMNNSGSYSGTTISEKRIIPIAPLSSEVVFVEDLTVLGVLDKLGIVKDYCNMPVGLYYKKFKSHARLRERGGEVKLNKKFERQYNEANSILTCKTVLNYSFTEEMKSPKEVTASNLAHPLNASMTIFESI